MTKYAKELDFMASLSSQAVQMMKEGYQKSPILDKDHGIDIVTKTDQAIDDVCRQAISSAFPQDSILSEENANREFFAHPNRRFWTIDPIDGTWNYVNGIPLFGFQASLVDNQQLAASLLTLPLINGGEVYRAEKNKGATLNGKPITVQQPAHLKQSILLFGDLDLREPHYAEKELHKIARVKPAIGLGRILGSSAVNFAFVSTGRAAGFFMFNQKLWDLAPGLLLAEEAGAFISEPDGAPFHFLESKDVAVAASAEVLDLIVNA
jgi:myo-inositol-1(or 4)-monophosphatase